MLLNEGYRGDYRAVPKIAILVTDGKAYRPTETYASAQHAKDSGINLFAVGIGSDINLQELETISSSPSSSHVFLVSEFNKLLSIVSSVAEGTCSGNVLQLIHNVKKNTFANSAIDWHQSTKCIIIHLQLCFSYEKLIL